MVELCPTLLNIELWHQIRVKLAFTGSMGLPLPFLNFFVFLFVCDSFQNITHHVTSSSWVSLTFIPSEKAFKAWGTYVVTCQMCPSKYLGPICKFLLNLYKARSDCDNFPKVYARPVISHLRYLNNMTTLRNKSVTS